jgi:hypothetical protein
LVLGVQGRIHLSIWHCSSSPAEFEVAVDVAGEPCVDGKGQEAVR